MPYPQTIFLAEWGNPSISVGKCGFDFDYLNHDNEGYNRLIRYEKGQNVLPELEKGENYFSPQGKGSIQEFLSFTGKIIEDVAGKGAYVLPTGYHDVPRISVGKSVAQLKLYFAFMMSFKTVPLIYYGDEIGMQNNFSVMKDGGYIRTGARTPMQWTNGKNRGFSSAEEIYLPVDNEQSLSVEAQEEDKNSLLSFVRKLGSLKKSQTALSYSADLKIKEKEYPRVFERSDGAHTITIYINPSQQTFVREGDFSETLLLENAKISGKEITLLGESVVMVKK